MRLVAVLAFVMASSLFFSAVGCTIGYEIATVAPQYYRTGLNHGYGPEFLRVEPELPAMEVGMGLGLIQGAAAGAAVGVIVVAILNWYELRKGRMQVPA